MLRKSIRMALEIGIAPDLLYFNRQYAGGSDLSISLMAGERRIKAGVQALAQKIL